jgi:16S rRNA processing protein RimM
LSAGDRLAVGLVRGVHAKRGAVRVEILTDRPEDRFRRGTRLYREGSEEPLTIHSAHPDDPGWLVRFDEVRDRDAAEALRDAYLEVLLAPGEELPRGEYYWHEVVGSSVVGLDGAALGTVVDVYRAGGAEVFVVRGEPFGEFDLPAVRDFIRIFAPRRGEIVIDVAALELAPPARKRPRGRRSSKGVVVPSVDGPVAADSAGPVDAAPSPGEREAE